MILNRTKQSGDGRFSYVWHAPNSNRVVFELHQELDYHWMLGPEDHALLESAWRLGGEDAIVALLYDDGMLAKRGWSRAIFPAYTKTRQVPFVWGGPIEVTHPIKGTSSGRVKYTSTPTFRACRSHDR